MGTSPEEVPHHPFKPVNQARKLHLEEMIVDEGPRGRSIRERVFKKTCGGISSLGSEEIFVLPFARFKIEKGGPKFSVNHICKFECN